MKLLILDQYSEPGGAQLNLLSGLRAMRAAGWQAVVGLPGNGALFPQIQAMGYETVRIPCGPFRSGEKSPCDALRFASQLPRLVRQIHKLVSGVKPDILYINGPRLLPAAALAAPDIPAVFHANSYLGPGVIRDVTERSLRRLHARVIACCRFVAEPWTGSVGTEHISIIYNGVPGPERPLYQRNSAAPVIGCIGRIAPEKGQLEFFQVAKYIHAKLPHCRFAIYGAPLFTAAASRYAERVAESAQGLPVTFAGWTDDVYTALSQLDLLLVPSASQEATTRVILEAFAAGVPVVAFASGGIPEVIENGKTGWLVHSTEEMAETSVNLLGDSAQLAAVSRSARASWSSRFTLEAHQHNVLQQLESIAARGVSPASRT